MRKVLLTSFVFGVVTFLLLGGAYLFREQLLRFGAARFLPADQVTLTQLEGLSLTASRLGIARLEFLLHESGQRLFLTDLDVAFVATSLLRAPALESINIGSAQLTPDEGAARDGRGEEARQGRRFAMQLGEVLTLLREFPLAGVSIDEFHIPQRSQPLALTLERGDGTLDGHVASGPLELRAAFAQPSPHGAATLQLALTRNETSVGDVMLTLVPDDAAWAVSGTGMLEIADMDALLGELEQVAAPVPLRAVRLDFELAGAVADDLGGLAAGDPQTFTLGLQAGSRVVLPADLAEGLGELTLEASDRMELAVSTGAGLVLSRGRLPLRLDGSWRDTAASVDAVLSVTDCGLAADAACAVQFDGDASVGTYALDGSISATALGNGTYDLASSGLTLGGLPEWLPRFDVLGRVQAQDDATYALSATLRAREAPTTVDLGLEAVYEPAGGGAEIRAVLPELAFMEEGSALSAWFVEWPFVFDVLAGSVAAEADLAWNSGTLSGLVSAELKGLGGFYGDYFFRGLDGALQANVDTSKRYPLAMPPQTLSAAGLDVGLPMENLRLDFSFDNSGVLQVDAFTLDVLDGSVSGNDITYDLTRERNPVLVEFAGLEIARMMDLIDYEGVEATGAVSGELPLTLTPNGVEVAAGELHADAPGGTIRYLAAAEGATGNAGLDLVHQALGNYRYDRLASGIEYAPDGELLLSMKLEGHNPDMQNGQRINLNLNLSNNIPDLLESLQAARRIEDFLEAQYQ